ncbi:MAG: acyltransferase family protein [Novosphingobium sp.]
MSRLPGIEALRFFAALCILLLHTRAVFGGARVFGKGYLAVEFFLMLSGFLMAMVQEQRLKQPGRFIVKRYKRLWPTMALGGLLGLPRLFIQSASHSSFFATAAANFALIPAWWGRFVFQLNIPAWTIFYELVANALHALIFRHFKLWAIGLGIALLAPVMVWIGQHWGSFDVGAKPGDFLAGLPRILFAYLIGIALGRMWRNGPPIPVPPLLAIPAMPAILAASWYFAIDKTWHFDMLFTVIACPLMIAGGMRLARFHRAAGLLGQLSFPLFAVQMPILEGAKMLGFNGWEAGTAAFASGIAAAFLTSRYDTWRKEKAA